MAESPQTFQELMERVRQGSEEASRQLYDRYARHVMRVVRRNLHPKLRPKFDSLDFAQDVWASFFTGQPGEQKFENPDALVAFLGEVARNKVAGVFRERLQRRQYNVNRENSLDGSAAYLADKLIGPDPTGSQVLGANETYEGMAKGQPAGYGRILELLHQGHTHEEIAAALGVNEKTIRRLLRRVQRSLTHEPGGVPCLTTAKRVRRRSGPGLDGIGDAGTDPGQVEPDRPGV